MLDEELIGEIKETLPDVPHVFFSSIVNQGIAELKDLIWDQLNKQ